MPKTTVFAIIAAASMLAPAIAADPDSANSRMPGCRELAEAMERAARNSNNPYRSGDDFNQGLCGGTIQTLMFVARFIGVCRPHEATLPQAIRVIIQYIDAQPERMHEDFNVLAIEALHNAWPCQQKQQNQ
jgi:hypothetical protein